MKRTYELNDPDVLLVGHLEIHRQGDPKGRPYLTLNPWCPFCRCAHRITWPDESHPDMAMGPLEMPMACSGFSGRDIYAAINPEHEDEARRTTERFGIVLRRFVTSSKLSRQPASQ